MIFGKDGDGNYGYYGADGSLIPFKNKTDPLYLFNVGDENESVTGGWVSNGVSGGATSTAPTITNRNPQFQAYLTGGTWRTGIVRPANSIDLTDYTLLKFVGYYSTDYARTGMLYVLSNPDSISNPVKSAILSGSTGETIIDVSELEGEYYIAPCISSSGQNCYLYMDSLVLK